MDTTSSSQGTSSSNTLDHNTPPTHILEGKVRCGVCGTLTEPVYLGDCSCWEYAPKPHPCRNNTKGCTYSDINGKSRKHKMYYCQYSTECYICRKNITGTTLESHYTQAHDDVTSRAGTVCTLGPAKNWKWLIIDCDFGKVVCAYRLVLDSEFLLSVSTALPAAQLYKYRCTVELSHPDTGHTLTRTPTVEYDIIADWWVTITDYNAYVHDGMVNIKINITEIDDPRQFNV